MVTTRFITLFLYCRLSYILSWSSSLLYILFSDYSLFIYHLLSVLLTFNFPLLCASTYFVSLYISRISEMRIFFFSRIPVHQPILSWTIFDRLLLITTSSYTTFYSSLSKAIPISMFGYCQSRTLFIYNLLSFYFSSILPLSNPVSLLGLLALSLNSLLFVIVHYFFTISYKISQKYRNKSRHVPELVLSVGHVPNNKLTSSFLVFPYLYIHLQDSLMILIYIYLHRYEPLHSSKS